MVKEKTLIKCDNCGSTNVFDEEAPEEVKVTILSMNEYIEKHRSTSTSFIYGDVTPICGVSHMEQKMLKCLDCGFTRLYDCVVYT